MDTLRFSIAYVLSRVLSLLAQRWDRRRLRPDQRAGTWNYASWGAALYAFGPFSMIAWVWVAHHDWSRWRARGGWVTAGWTAALLLVGIVAAGLVFGVVVGVDALVARALGQRG